MTVIWKPQTALLIRKTDSPIRLINDVARVCYQSETPEDNVTQEFFIKHLIQMGHESPLEFVDFTWFIQTSRAIANELVRHRLASYMQESTRYVKYTDLEMLKPLEEELNSYKKTTFTPSELEEAIKHYKYLIDHGIKPEFARDFLPLGLITHIYCKMNLREFRHFLKLRFNKAAHPQMRKLAQSMVNEVNKVYNKNEVETMLFSIPGLTF